MIFDFSYLILLANNKYYIHITHLYRYLLLFWHFDLFLSTLFYFVPFPLFLFLFLILLSIMRPFETNASLILLFWIQSPLAIQRDMLFRVYWLISHINSFVLSLVFDWSLHTHIYIYIYIYLCVCVCGLKCAETFPKWMTKLVLREWDNIYNICIITSKKNTQKYWLKSYVLP